MKYGYVFLNNAHRSQTRIQNFQKLGVTCIESFPFGTVYV